MEHRGLSTAAAALSARDAALADADRMLAELVRGAHDSAVESIRRIDSVRAEIDAAVARRRIDDVVGAHEFARFLIDKNRELHSILIEARAVAAAKTIALQDLAALYRGELPA